MSAINGARGKLGRRLILPLLAAMAVSGCGGSMYTSAAAEDKDPFEPVNRGVFWFNDIVATITRPLGLLYNGMPAPITDGVSNLLDTLDEPGNAMNLALQGKFRRSLTPMQRFALNVFPGFGVVDVASRAGLERYEEDFGQTLAVWTNSDGNTLYLVLPLLGPSSPADAVGVFVDGWLFQQTYPFHDDFHTAYGGLSVWRGRARLLEYEDLIDAATLDGDRYATVRSLYREGRRHAITDGEAAEGEDGELTF